MIAEPAIFTCSICGEPSTDICAYCTKDACANHRCTRCKRCSDCCECEVPLSAEEPPAEPVVEAPVVEAPANPLGSSEASLSEAPVASPEPHPDEAVEPVYPPPDSENQF
jgi:hypothetical protein